ncbi:hypothetical protein PPERSA_03601 [Pseudocohnilembus persalinus]|uniref:Uncharacterized protein n=1 Tax=Pseudocohnilembus persalinus TaxID=266149 RepID=A0A0V0QQ36_PSEPJ|nr:hypothetical protein PPERSA_03601 [Pseudocohnilembus persalinus]|eukprot:KRX04361.1 hypothetical protein PPERSA_03601 [Pseudocohnilembus persalinus]
MSQSFEHKDSNEQQNQSEQLIKPKKEVNFQRRSQSKKGNSTIFNSVSDNNILSNRSEREKNQTGTESQNQNINLNENQEKKIQNQHRQNQQKQITNYCQKSPSKQQQIDLYEKQDNKYQFDFQHNNSQERYSDVSPPLGNSPNQIYQFSKPMIKENLEIQSSLSVIKQELKEYGLKEINLIRQLVETSEILFTTEKINIKNSATFNLIFEFINNVPEDPLIISASLNVLTNILKRDMELIVSCIQFLKLLINNLEIRPDITKSQAKTLLEQSIKNEKRYIQDVDKIVPIEDLCFTIDILLNCLENEDEYEWKQIKPIEIVPSLDYIYQVQQYLFCNQNGIEKIISFLTKNNKLYLQTQENISKKITDLINNFFNNPEEFQSNQQQMEGQNQFNYQQQENQNQNKDILNNENLINQLQAQNCGQKLLLVIQEILKKQLHKCDDQNNKNSQQFLEISKNVSESELLKAYNQTEFIQQSQNTQKIQNENGQWDLILLSIQIIEKMKNMQTYIIINFKQD